MVKWIGLDWIGSDRIGMDKVAVLRALPSRFGEVVFKSNLYHNHFEGLG